MAIKKGRRKYLFICLAAVFLAAGCTEKVDHMEQAQAALTGGRYDEALEEFKFFIQEQEERKVQDFSDERRKKLNLSEAYKGIGIIEFEQEQYPQAEETFKKVLELEGVNTPILYRFIGISLMEQEKYDEALDYFTEGVGLEAENIVTIEDEETAKDMTDKDSAKTMEKYTEVICEMRKLKIECYEKLYDWKNAAGAAEEYIKEYPDDEAVQKEATFLRTR